MINLINYLIITNTKSFFLIYVPPDFLLIILKNLSSDIIKYVL